MLITFPGLKGGEGELSHKETLKLKNKKISSENFSMSSFHLNAEFLSTFTSNEIFSAPFSIQKAFTRTGEGRGVEGAIFQIRSIKRLK